jgi:hypothetical protein
MTLAPRRLTPLILHSFEDVAIKGNSVGQGFQDPKLVHNREQFPGLAIFLCFLAVLIVLFRYDNYKYMGAVRATH